MGLRTSRPLLAEDGGSGYEQEEDNEDITEDSDTQTESCWRYMIRKLYSMLGYQELSVNDISRQAKRKREKLEDNEEDDLKDEKEPSQKMAKLDELLQEVVIVEEDDKPLAKPDASQNLEDTQSFKYLDYSLLTDHDTIRLLSCSLTMVVMRGLPGSGKSTVVSTITRVYPHAVVCSADHYFMNDGKYEYSSSRLKSAHLQCQDKALGACEAGERLVVVDNTGVKKWELVNYFRMAQLHRYTVILLEPRTPWRFNVEKLAEKNTHGVPSHILAKKIKEWKAVFPLYYGWFLHITDTKLLMEAARGMIERCLVITEVLSDIFERTGCKNMEELVNHYSWLKSVHSTSRFPQGEKKGKEHVEETNMLGKASSLTIAGFILTPRTLGARVMLTREQLTVYHQNDLEPFSMLPQNKSRPPDTDSADTRGCEPTLRPLEDVEAGDIAGPVRGRRAHITLATVPGVKPVQTGLDQLDALLAVSRRQGPGHQLGGGTLYGVGQGRWVIALDTPLTIQTIYTGQY